MTRIDIADGKYSIIHDHGAGLHVLRYGEAWGDFTGNGFVLALAHEVEALRAPVDMLLYCPACGVQHIDAPARDSHAPCALCDAPPAAECYAFCDGWTNRPHRSHLCAACGHQWRPADVPTNGVQALKTKGANDSPPVPREAVVGAARGLLAALDQPFRYPGEIGRAADKLRAALK